MHYTTNHCEQQSTNVSTLGTKFSFRNIKPNSIQPDTHRTHNTNQNLKTGVTYSYLRQGIWRTLSSVNVTPLYSANCYQRFWRNCCLTEGGFKHIIPDETKSHHRKSRYEKSFQINHQFRTVHIFTQTVIQKCPSCIQKEDCKKNLWSHTSRRKLQNTNKQGDNGIYYWRADIVT